MSHSILKVILALHLCFCASISEAAEPSKDTGRTLWKHPGGYIALGRLWQHRTNGKIYSLVETARNPVFVDLFDPARGYSIRLYDSKMLIRDNKNPGGPEAIWLTKRATGNWDDGAARNKWSYPEGLFEVKGLAWFEPAAHGVNMFVERTRTPDVIELDDPQRGYVIRLSAIAMQIRGGKYKDFKKLYAGGWLAAAPPARIEFKIDASDAPAAKDFALRAKTLAETWYPIIVHRLQPNHKLAPRSYTIVVKHMEKRGVPAFTRNGNDHSITFSADYIADHPKDYGMIIHELTHVVQNYNFKKSKNTYWLSEGIADYIRNFEFEPESRRDIKPDTSFRKGYRTAAGFLNWIMCTYDRRTIEKVNISLQEDTYDEQFFEKITGHPLNQLWDEFRTQHKTEKQHSADDDTPEPNEQ